MKRTVITNVGRCFINGRVYENIRGTITVKDGKMFVNGKPIEDWNESDEKTINITIEGNVEALDVVGCSTITVNGDAGKVKTGSGDVTVNGIVGGNVETGSGDVECSNVEGDVETGSGDVHCGDVRGRVSTGAGDIYRK